MQCNYCTQHKSRHEIMSVRTLRNLYDRRIGRIIVTLATTTLFIHQFHIFLAHGRSRLDKLEAKSDNRVAIVEDNLVNKDPGLDFECQCKELITALQKTENNLCSDYSTATRGPQQRVVSVSYNGQQQDVAALKQLAEASAMHFPSHTLRIYHNVTSDLVVEHGQLCQLFCSSDNVDLCNVRHLGKYGDSSNFYAPLWKYMAVADPLAEEVHFRQAEQVLTDRENAAINDWRENSEASFVILRDHPALHFTALPKSMFGLRKTNEALGKKLKGAYERMMLLSKSMPKSQYDDLEALLLEALFWPIAEEDNVSYDSYFCQNFKGVDTRSWPTERQGRQYVGAVMGENLTLDMECPQECRRKPEWKWC